jgi:hypothetical protein
MKAFKFLVVLLTISCLSTAPRKAAPLRETPPPPADTNAFKIQQENCEGLLSAYTQEDGQRLADDCYENYKKSLCLKTDKDCLKDLNGFCWTSIRMILINEIQSCVENKEESWHEYPVESDPFPSNL